MALANAGKTQLSVRPDLCFAHGLCGAMYPAMTHVKVM